MQIKHMVSQIRHWRYSHILRGSVFLLLAALSLYQGGSLKLIISGAFLIISIVCFLENSFHSSK